MASTQSSTIITACDIIDGQYEFRLKNGSTKFDKLCAIKGEDCFMPEIKFEDVCAMDAKTKKSLNLKFDESASITKAIGKIEDALEKGGSTLSRRFRTDRDNPLLFLDLEKECVVYNHDRRIVKPCEIKCGATVSGLVEVKWVYRKDSDELSLKLVVVALKFKNVEKKRRCFDDL